VWVDRVGVLRGELLDDEFGSSNKRGKERERDIRGRRRYQRNRHMTPARGSTTSSAPCLLTLSLDGKPHLWLPLTDQRLDFPPLRIPHTHQIAILLLPELMDRIQDPLALVLEREGGGLVRR
jgi:hypothetical protein